MPEGESIKRVAISYSNRVNSLRFYTDNDVQSPEYGNYEGEQRIFTLPTGYKIYGIYGKINGFVVAIGFHLISYDVRE